MNIRFVTLLLAVVTCAALSASAADYFIKFEGIDGESSDGRRPGEIDVMSFSWGVSNTANAASGLPTGKRQHKPFSISKHVDKATPKLFERCCNGAHIPKVVLTFVRQSAAGGPEDYLIITMEDVVITSYSIGASEAGQGSQLPMEEISMSYGKITYRWIPTKEETFDSWKAQR